MARTEIFGIVNNEWNAEGTGFLINAHTVVTVAHNVFGKDGRATQVHVHAGFRGNDHVEPEIQVGEYVAMHWGYYRTGGEAYDFAVIRLKKPFSTVHNYIPWKNCPVKGNGGKIAVVGYPCDIPKGAKGKYMYVSQGPMKHNLAETGYILRHKLDTECGNSGSPVLYIGADGQVRGACGIHQAGEKDKSNYATAIGHKGNRVNDFERGIDIIVAALNEPQNRYNVETPRYPPQSGLTRV